MNGLPDQFGGHNPDIERSPRRNFGLILLAVVIFVECAIMAAASAYLLIELFVDEPLSFASAVAIFVCAALATVFLAILGVNTLRATPWIRGAALVWQVLQIAVAIGAFQGEFAQPAVGWGLLLPAIAAMVLLFTPNVAAATHRPE